MPEIRRLDYSVFQLPDVIYLGDFPYSCSENMETHSSTSSASTFKKASRVPNVMRHSRKSVSAADRSLYIKLPNSDECREWILELKRFPRLQVYSPSTGEPEKSIRFARTLTCRVLEARIHDLDKSTLTPSPEIYIEIVFGNRIWGRTSISQMSKSAFWREDFTYRDMDSSDMPKISFHLRQRNHSGDPIDDPLIARITLPYSELKANGDRETWYTLEDLPEDEEGFLCLKISLEEIHIVDAKHYGPVRAAFDALSHQSLALLNLSEDYIPRSEITSMSDVCLNIVLASSTYTPVVNWLSALISQDVTKTRLYIVRKQGRDCFKDFCTKDQHEFKQNLLNTMFRGNSILTKSLEKFMRLIGRDYLGRIIGLYVQTIVGQHPDLEIDPTRMNLSSPPDNLSKEDEELVKTNQSLLLHHTTRLWYLIKNAVNDMPLSFKIIFRHLSDELTDKLLFSKKAVNNSIAGFLFLRFFCPGLLNPKLFGFIDAQQANSVHRPLTLITKVIQAFANRNRFGLKEPYMIPMNIFFDEHESELLEYFENVKLESKTSQEVNDLKEKHLSDVVTTSPSHGGFKNVPLSEHIFNPFLIDEHLNFARFFNVWKAVWEPNEEALFKRIEDFLVRKEALLSGSQIEPSDELKTLESEKDKISEQTRTKIKAVHDELSHLFSVCQECSSKVESIITSLRDEAEVFHVDDIPKYCRHISLIRDNSARTLKHVAGIAPATDWSSASASASARPSLSSLSSSSSTFSKRDSYKPLAAASGVRQSPSLNFIPLLKNKSMSLDDDLAQAPTPAQPLLPPNFDFTHRRRSHSSPDMNNNTTPAGDTIITTTTTTKRTVLVPPVRKTSVTAKSGCVLDIPSPVSESFGEPGGGGEHNKPAGATATATAENHLHAKRLPKWFKNWP